MEGTMRCLPYFLPVLFLALFMSLLVLETSYSQDWPHFWPARFDFSAGNDPKVITMGNFNKDSHQDLAVAVEEHTRRP